MSSITFLNFLKTERYRYLDIDYIDLRQCEQVLQKSYLPSSNLCVVVWGIYGKCYPLGMSQYKLLFISCRISKLSEVFICRYLRHFLVMSNGLMIILQCSLITIVMRNYSVVLMFWILLIVFCIHLKSWLTIYFKKETDHLPEFALFIVDHWRQENLNNIKTSKCRVLSFNSHFFINIFIIFINSLFDFC